MFLNIIFFKYNRNGAWSDSSREWSTIGEDVKRDLRFVKANDGEFW